LSLADVEKATRIRQKYLAAFEQGDYANLPRGAIARGFLRNLADFLGLDPLEMTRRYTQESGDANDETMIAEIGKPRLIDYRPAEIELLDTRPNLSWVRWVVALLLIGALAAAGWWFLGREGSPAVLSAFGPGRTPTATPSVTPTPWIITAAPSPAPQSAAKASPTSDLLPLPTPTVPPTITPTSRPTATPEVVTRIALVMRADQRAWVRVTADNVMVLEGTLEPGQSRTWEANTSLKVLTGNGGGVDLILNGVSLGKMGSVGQVIERTWVVDQGQVMERTPTPGAPPAPTATPTPAG
jgi:cytoskeletal protein RodZ